MSATTFLITDARDDELDPEGITHAGLALVAANTGRVLMLQRAITEDDPAAGTWEFAGGGLDDGESPLEGALREFAEEVGVDLDRLVEEVVIVDAWVAPAGNWAGFVGVVALEDFIPINRPVEDRDVDNPDESDSSNPDEVVAWFDPADLPDMPALRAEVRDTPWELLRFNTQENADMTITDEPIVTISDGQATTSNGTSAEFRLPPPDVLGLPEDIDAVELESTDAEWEALLVVEGVPTGDGRQIGVGALGHRDLPLPLMGMFRNPDGGAGHAAAEIIGRIDEITFVERGPGRREVWGKGIFDTAEPAGARAARLNKKGMMRGVSVDLDDITGSLTMEGRELFTKGRIMGATMTPFAAFAEATIRLVGELRVQSEAAMGCSPCEAARAEAQARIEAMLRSEDPALVASGDCGCGGDCCQSLAESDIDLFDLLEVLDIWALTASASALTPQARVFTPSTELAPSAALVASGAPAKPPLAWFQPVPVEQRDIRPVRIHSDGKVDGYAALWGTCHTGFANCVVVPRAGIRGYSGFQRGQVLTAEGTVVATGPIVMGPEHVAREPGHSIPQVQDKYAAVGCRVADVALFEDHIGLWCCGAAKPDITDADIRVFNASDGVSPHWLPPRDGGDLAVLCVVTYSGFQTGNEALVASGAMQVTIENGEMGALVGHNPGFDNVVALRAQIERLTAQFESLAPVIAFVEAQQAALTASEAEEATEEALAALDGLAGDFARGDSALSRALIDALGEEAASDGEVHERMGEAAGISASTVRQILGAQIMCPPADVLAGLARVAGTSQSALIAAAERDGCTRYDGD